jgi:hypothetical protein
MTRIKQEEDLGFSASIRGQKLVYSSIADFGIKNNEIVISARREAEETAPAIS